MTEPVNPYAAPAGSSFQEAAYALPVESTVPDATSRAGFGIRAGARIIDMVFLQIVSAVAGAVGGVVIAVTRGQEGIERITSGLAIGFLGQMAIGLAASLVYSVVAESVGGATVGKAICGLRVLGDGFKPVGVTAALVRNLGYFVDSLFFGYIGYQAMEKDGWYRRNGDWWAGTVVIKAAGVPEASRRSGALVAGGIIAASVLSSAVTVGALLSVI